MKAIQIRETGGPEVLQLVDLPIPVPGPGQVLIRVESVGMNFIEIYFRKGQYKATLPMTPGSEAAGTVEECGPGVNGCGFKPGDTVAAVGVLGSYAEYALVPAAQLIKVPDGVTPEQAAAAMLQGMTAHYLAYSTWPLKSGETCLIHAGAGGVGLLLTQMAAKIGARVITTVSTEEKAELSREAGASDVIVYSQQDFVAEVKRLTNNKGVDVVYDSVGKTTFDGSLNCLRPRGLMALFGGSSGAVPPFDLIQLSGKGSLFLTRPTLWHYISTRDELEKRAGDVLNWVKSGDLKLRMEHMYPLTEAGQAQSDMENRRTTGKILLEP
ncbi:quinone oxidoreductase family protein [Occallatibacter riparius]|uniref:Quinone oxidoreductase n=1 Tax=Occallatibacter riparius TaxID=1002689 RepID=A0A9J7BLJ4_9BACT|nr:quinone oxidoreductase [Occallatibacter riparius]UWZ83756.1 quinone oxidoreductase [Occallatibacter riparius]